MGETFIIVEGGKAIQCLVCDKTSNSPGDIKYLYCGYCNRFHRDMETDDIRPFPIQRGEATRTSEDRLVHPKESSIPWWLAEEAFKYYKERGHTQSLVTIAKRGGFGREELLKLLRREK